MLLPWVSIHEHSSAEQYALCTDGILSRPKFQPRLIFVLDCVPSEHIVATSDDRLLGCMTQGKKTLAKALVF
ncbi:MAG: hypothetical protein SH868_14830 [Bythopirellula sp.]|nr:hypothetical protein [Bythopirellula sp.]